MQQASLTGDYTGAPVQHFPIALGWQPTPTPTPTNTPTSTPTPTETPTPTAIPIPTVRYSGDPLLLPDVDSEGCPANDTYQCAEQVYDQYYVAYQSQYSRVPVLRDLIAVLFKLELVINNSDSRAAMGNNFVNACGSGCNRTQLIAWLSSLQGWTDFGDPDGVVDTAPLVAYPNQSIFEGIADQIVGESISWPGACTSTNTDVPCCWGNWALGDTDYLTMNRLTINLILKSLMVLLVTISLKCADLQAQNELTGSIVYVKFLNNEVKQYISLSSTGSSTIEISTSECSSLSQLGEFLVALDPETSVLRVYDLNDGSTVGEYSWAADWESCQFRWDSQDRLSILTPSQETITFDVFSNEVIPTQEPDNIIALTPESRLPDYVPGENVVTSPDSRFVLYQQCADENLSPSGDFCVREGQMVIYDVSAREVVEVLEDTNATILGSNGMPPDPIAAFWSPSGRFLLYFTSGRDASNPIHIFDTQIYHYVDTTNTSTMSIDPRSAGFRWSPDESKIGFWINLVPLDPMSGQRFVTIDMQTGAINTVDQTFNLSGSNNWRWSPVGQAVALVTNAGELLSIDLDTATTSILDIGVYAVEAWRNEFD